MFRKAALLREPRANLHQDESGSERGIEEVCVMLFHSDTEEDDFSGFSA